MAIYICPFKPNKILNFSSCNFKRGAPCHLMNPIITSTDIILGETTISSLTIELEKLILFTLCILSVLGTPIRP